jgi:hypothetical protein
VKVSRLRACVFVATTGVVIVVALLLGAVASIGNVASSGTDLIRHAAFGGAGETPRASAVLQDEANAPGFRARVKHRRSAVAAGGTAIFIVRLRSFYAFDSAVRLKAFDLPSNSQASFSPNPIGPNGTSTLTIKTSETTTVGSHVFLVLATSHGLTAIGFSTVTIGDPSDAVR